MTTAAIHSDLSTLMAAVRIGDTGQAHVLGRAVEPASSAIPGWAAVASDRVEDLAAALYSRCYVRPSGRVDRGIVDADRDGLFQSALIAAAPADWVWERGWRVVDRGDDGRLRVRRNSVLYWTDSSRVRLSTSPGVGLVIGESCAVLVPRVRRRLLPGFHTVVGAEPGTDEDESDRLVRLYWHLRERSAAALLNAVVTTLDDAAIPFSMKVLRDPVAYVRADAGVLYLPRNRFAAARPLLHDVHQRIVTGLRADPPMLTLRLDRGLGLAEDPGAGTSFGQHCCRIVAEALWRLHDDSGSATAHAAVAAAFTAHGLDPTAPHRMAGSDTDYSWPTGGVTEPPPPRRHHADRYDEEVLIAAASQIGRSICASARWDSTRTRCTWIARTVAGRSGPNHVFMPHSATLGQDLYAGTAGVGLFLAQLAALTGDAEFRDTARGALAAAVNGVLRGGETVPGLYTGVPGVVLTAVRTGQLLGERAPVERLSALLTKRPADIEDDLMSGRAGEILALTQLAETTDWPAADALVLARRLGTELLGSIAEHGPVGRPRSPDKPAWTGLSHGAAGVALALLALANRTDDTAFLDAARAGFSYEDTLFDSEAGNWPDFRERPFDDPGTPAFMIAWCNGAPGIALSRLRARDLDPRRQADHTRSATAALATTLAEVERRQPLADWDATYCHGVAGLVETLWTGGHLLGRDDLLEAARSATFRLARHSVTELRSGVPGGTTNPSLMLGTAGIGYQLLRVAAPGRVPSILLGWWDIPGGQPRHDRHPGRLASTSLASTDDDPRARTARHAARITVTRTTPRITSVTGRPSTYPGSPWE